MIKNLNARLLSNSTERNNVYVVFGRIDPSFVWVAQLARGIRKLERPCAGILHEMENRFGD